MSDPSPPPEPDAVATEVLRFEPWQSAVDTTFWAELARRKLDTFGLSEDPVPVDAQFACAAHAEVSSPAQLDARAFEAWSASAGDARASGRRRMPGFLRNVNTFERFKAFDRGAMLAEAGRAVWKHIVSGDALRDPNALNAFAVLAFADLKSWAFTYWFCFPALKTPAVRRVPRATREPGVDPALAASLDARLRGDSNGDFAWATTVRYGDDDDGVRVVRETRHAPLTEMNAMLAEWHSAEAGSRSDDGSARTTDVEVFLSFADPCSNPDHPGWALRNLATLAAARFDLGERRRLSVISVRTRAGRVSPEHSRVFELVFPEVAIAGAPTSHDSSNATAEPSEPACPFPAVGWELNPRGRAGPRRADLGESMDPTRLAVAAAELNLKLMRWRLLPDLDLDTTTSTKCLIIGAGTLGCAVARTLLGWGVRAFTFVDSGRVSFSNPARQSLFEFADCLDGGKLKAEAAAANLTRVFPGVKAQGVVMAVPMPGHPVVGDDARAAALRDVERLEALVRAHDAVFCLTDTRESRWLPTLLCAANDTTLINAALGFDSYLVMRHGGGVEGAGALGASGARDEGRVEAKEDAERSAPLRSRLGCYFCNDVMAPGDSTRDRTLDQQCTVTRPGLAPIAGALAAEMLVALRHWRGDGDGDAREDAEKKTRARAPAPPAHVGAPSVGAPPVTPLGIVPHQIRGHVSAYSQTLFAAPAFDKCTACSAKVVRAFRGLPPEAAAAAAAAAAEDAADEETRKKARDAFLLAAFADPTFLEDATGLTAVHRAADDAEWLGTDTDGDDF